jgi:hypothetical protein
MHGLSEVQKYLLDELELFILQVIADTEPQHRAEAAAQAGWTFAQHALLLGYPAEEVQGLGMALIRGGKSVH